MVATGELSNRGADRALKLLFGITTGGAETSPSAVYLALATSAVADTDTLTQASAKEVTESGYVRKQITFGAPADDGGVEKTKNSSSISFGPFAVGGTAITHAFITDASTGTSGDVLYRFTLGTTKNTNADESLTINGNDLQVGLD